MAEPEMVKLAPIRHCDRCGRVLKDPKYVKIGMGRICERKNAEEEAGIVASKTKAVI